MATEELITAAAAADLLGVQRQTVYAYVSRGILTRVSGTDARGHRVSLFDRAAVQTLAQSNQRPRTGVFELHIDTSVTDLDPSGRFLYRGRDACELATTSTFEEVAELLWGLPQAGDWVPDELCAETWRRLELACPPEATPVDRFRLALTLLSAAHPTHDRTPAAVTAAARRAIIACAGSIVTPSPVAGQAFSVAAGVARGLAVGAQATESERLVNAALVLMADHELATSTVAARAAASTHSDHELTLLTGAAAMGGPLHGGASRRVERLLESCAADGVQPTIDRLSRPPAGFGHSVYQDIDPRGELLLDAIAGIRPELDELIASLTLAVRRRFSLAPNVDLGLAALTQAIDLRPGSGEAIFTLARLAGMTAHALEELQHRLRFRPRAVYTGESGDVIP